MDIQLLYKVVLPTLARSGVAFIGISTLDDPFSFWSQMIDLKDDDGKGVFKTIRYSLVCEDCIKAGLETSCKHKMGDLPYWQDETQHNKLEKIMQDKSEAFLTETKGFLSNPNIKPAFDVKMVQHWMNRPQVQKIKTRAAFFVSVDPAAGGNLSDYAIVTCCYFNGRTVVRIQAHPHPLSTPTHSPQTHGVSPHTSKTSLSTASILVPQTLSARLFLSARV